MRKVVLLALATGLVLGCAGPQQKPQARTTSRYATSPPVRQTAPQPQPGVARSGGTPARTVPAPSAPSGASVVAPELDPNTYRLAPGDVVKVDVFNEPELSVAVGVESSGIINYPLLGQVHAAGLTVRQLQERLAAGLRNGYLVNPDVRVAVAQYRPIYVTGQVRKVGSYPYTIGLTVEKALAMAGGITEFGSSKKVYVQHESAADSQRLKVDLDQSVLPGDTILVEERLF